MTLTNSENAPPTNITGEPTTTAEPVSSLSPSAECPTATTVPTPSAPSGKSVSVLFLANACSARHRNVSQPPFTPANATRTTTSSAPIESIRSPRERPDTTFATAPNDGPAVDATSCRYAVEGGDCGRERESAVAWSPDADDAPCTDPLHCTRYTRYRQMRCVQGTRWRWQWPGGASGPTHVTEFIAGTKNLKIEQLAPCPIRRTGPRSPSGRPREGRLCRLETTRTARNGNGNNNSRNNDPPQRDSRNASNGRPQTHPQTPTPTQTQTPTPTQTPTQTPSSSRLDRPRPCHRRRRRPRR